MFEDTFRSMTEQIRPSSALIHRTRQRMREETGPLRVCRPAPRRARRPLRRALLLAAVFTLIGALSLSALAFVPAANELLYLLSPGAAQFLRPVQLACEDQGIRMEVEAAMYDEDVIVAYLTLRDLEEDRLDETVDLYNYSIHGYRAFTSQLTHYDPETKTATLRLQGTIGEGAGGKNTLNLSSFLTHKTEYSGVPLALDSAESPRTMSLDRYSTPGGGGTLLQTLEKKGKISILRPGTAANPEGWNLDFVDVTGVGFVEGQLHVQLHWHGNVDDHGYVYLQNEAGEKILPSNVGFSLDETGENAVYGHDYEEYLLPVTPEELEGYQLFGHFWETGLYVEGNWSVTFQTEPVLDRGLSAQDVAAGQRLYDEVTVTPLGVTITGVGLSESRPEVELTTLDGGTVSLDSVVSWETAEGSRVKYVPAVPFSLEQLASVKIDGSEVALR